MGWPIVPGSQDEERAYRTSGAATNKLLITRYYHSFGICTVPVQGA